MFSRDLAVQARKSMDMLGAIVEGLDDPEGLEKMSRELGRRHVGYGVTEAHTMMLERPCFKPCARRCPITFRLMWRKRGPASTRIWQKP